MIDPFSNRSARDFFRTGGLRVVYFGRATRLLCASIYIRAQWSSALRGRAPQYLCDRT